MKRRSFVKLSAVGLVASIVKPALAADEDMISDPLFPSYDGEAKMISTWSHGQEANRAGWKLMEEGKSSLEAVEAGARHTESDITNRSVGIGGMPDREGHVTLDACIMDWNSNCGSVGFLEGIAHPVSVAKHIMQNTPHIMLVGAGAKQYALKNKFETIKTPLPEVKKEWEKWKKEQAAIAKKPEINHENHDTIGLLAIDDQGRISGACTTSGWAYKLPGRLGDSPIIGSGLFIDQEVGGAVATGLGESIIRIAGSHTVVELMRQGKSPEQACKETVERLIRKHKDMSGLQCAFIAINTKGEVGGYSVFNGFNYALKTKNQDVLVDTLFDRKW
ncbi:N(4)-(beta-N-acetylglucosaminyl)-L-asparaginase [Fluviicola sp.]|jgi:isoaspartyl peptidase/L-asparaginase-like protein (Ntn-hydrolase superfamily)|uniref:isoaspartyl peptidase/L-asparaginase family protein n=1 Tax=Fluviicola sp. TaxID=1917219 RepID=UPI00282A6C51|nr:N(4)-(beta-N-acetylglucosaminyl)-L-asparaginase [Fluviicola sp.]MDR0802591.1 N(4)-(beta-N-acetylglucosaminyl)-L-asparaginase [Fluviicola sp.]